MSSCNTDVRTRYDHLTAVSELLVDMAASVVTAAGDPTERAAFNGGGGAGGAADGFS